MSQLNGNGNKNQGNVKQIAEELRQMKSDQQALDRRSRQIKFRCDHKDCNGRPMIQPGHEDGTYVCRACGTVVNAKLQNKVEIDRKLRDVINIIENIKLAANPELTPSLAKIEEGVDSLLGLYEKIILKQGQNNKNKNNNNNNNGNTRRASYGANKM